ncbi:MAG: hypothetical protein CL946_04695 [Ectothiorhodospiraceae bacterium]|nr:hypothetical protein [Ectothiorhodospiraceae bacterium]|tara:strand:- start:325 stop:615 length:291 start_codon:yes stop_codon:yes gene_type:complete
MKGYKGAICFFKSLGHGNMIVSSVPDYYESVDDLIEAMVGQWLYLGQCEVDVEFRDTRQDEIDAIDKQIEATKAELEMRINQLMGKKQELLAIESD